MTDDTLLEYRIAKDHSEFVSIDSTDEVLGVYDTEQEATLRMKTLVIRCATPDCDWGHRMSELGEEQLDLCYSEFRKHYMRRHGLEEWDDAHTHLDLERWMLTLIN